jgi:hypothetical protein
MPDKQAQIRDNIEKRDAGLVHFDIRNRADVSRASDIAAVDEFVTELNHNKLSSLWKQFKKYDAERLVTSILHKDMAYQYECMEIGLARATMRRFFDLFSESARFYSNAEFRPENGGLVSIGSYQPITNATFDSGIVAIDDNLIGFIWVEDED